MNDCGPGLTQEMIQHTRSSMEGKRVSAWRGRFEVLCAISAYALGPAVERHDGVGEGVRGVLEGFGGVEDQFGQVECSRVDEAGNVQHVGMKRLMEFKHGAVLRGAAQVQGVFREQPFADGTLLGMLDGVGGSGAKRLTQPGSQQQRDLPTHVGGDGVGRGDDRLGNVRNGRHG